MEAALVSNAPPPTAFQSAIDEQDDGSMRSQEHHDQKTEQNLAQAERRPNRSIQDAVIGGKMALLASLHGSQGRCHRASARSQQRSVHEGAEMAEGWLGEHLGKWLEQEEWIRGKHASTSGRETLSAHRRQQTVLPFLYLQRVKG